MKSFSPRMFVLCSLLGAFVAFAVPMSFYVRWQSAIEGGVAFACLWGLIVFGLLFLFSNQACHPK